MSPLIRLALAAGLAAAAAPAVPAPTMAQCIVDPSQIGSPCAGGIGSPPIVRGRPPAVQPITPPGQLRPPQLAPFRPQPVPAPREAESLSRKAPSTPLLPLPSAGAAQRCVTMYGSCPIPGGAIPSTACTCEGGTTGTAR
ncbi:hypothetical protein ACFW16_11170 [Inquilinus sp. NPDC058860]|uniref:hypothetical protein n=1 Tax=Inquilinus sp. NPDC058860 TaxID=3346652 RepID=UPI0036ACB731